MISRIEELMRHDTAGDPITGVQWSRRTTRKIAEELTAWGIAVSKNTVGRLLEEMGFKLRVNRKQIASTKNPDRNQQFLYIGQQRERFANQGLPVISVDAKKTEQVGHFKNAGAKWDRETVLVKDHDFRSEADGLAIPYGIYDTQANRGAVFVGTSHNTPAFAVDAIAQWWLKEGCQRYPTARELFILADGGGSNGPRCRVWREALYFESLHPLRKIRPLDTNCPRATFKSKRVARSPRCNPFGTPCGSPHTSRGPPIIPATGSQRRQAATAAAAPS